MKDVETSNFCVQKFTFLIVLSFFKMQHLIDIIETLVGDFFLLRYRKTCYVRFVSPKYFKPKLSKNKDANPSNTSDKSVIDFFIKEVVSNQDEIWNSVERYDAYI